MHTMHVVLEDGRKITITGFSDTEEMVRFASAIDPDSFDFNNITLDPVEGQEVMLFPSDSRNTWDKLIG